MEYGWFSESRMKISVLLCVEIEVGVLRIEVHKIIFSIVSDV